MGVHNLKENNIINYSVLLLSKITSTVSKKQTDQTNWSLAALARTS